MTDTRSKARAYAEDTLGVNQVWIEAEAVGKSLAKVLADLTDARVMRRTNERMVETIELELAEAERVKHTDMSVAAMERHLKTVYHHDADLQAARQGVRNWSDKVDELEFLRSAKEAQVRLLSARMVELGGYLQYLAATAQRAAVHETEETREAGETK